ncbi:TonB-dependent receptor [Erythrobacter sp. SCSIO 43205]|uniref:TonB-dependent receptor plug domain-containing protein n=1 Tax=Erythrobacter sp. SCSIO 43205 TaxID=2779361 RepID=UPI001CA928FA|nr:TonB-dependent receptor [Erythrobacter sp. SCSIO 43205]UAB77829.1 TonB-dependent receptor [Erythrobacter sp. SCSIO 43205]
MKFKYLLAAASTLALLPSALQAGTTDRNTDRQGAENPGSETIVVTANRTARPIVEVGASVTVIGEEEIVTRQASDVVDILRTVPGVTFNRNGGIGTATGVSIRGAQSAQTVVLVDGIKINDPSSIGGGFDFGPLLTGNIARVEVVRGSQSVLYGSQAIGGVVNLLTREPTEELGVFARSEYGSRDTAEFVGNVSGKFGPVAASIGGTYFTTDGFSTFNEDRGGAEDDGFESFGVNGKVDVEITDNVSLDLRAFYADGKTEIDGFLPDFSFGDTGEVSFREDFVGYAGINAALCDGVFRNRLGFGYTDINRRNFNNDTNFETFVGSGENRRFEYQGVIDADDAIEIVFGTEREESEYTSVSFGAVTAPEDAWINSVYAEVNVSPLEGLSLTGGVRYDDTDTFGSATVFAASGAYSPNGGTTVVRASYGEGFKAPSLFQRFSDFGNPDLTAEKSESWDAGITHSFLDGAAQVGITYFERDGTDEIGFAGCDASIPVCNDPATPRPFGTYVNVDSVSADGWEFSVALRPVDGFDIALNYTTISAFDDTTGNRLARRAKETASLVADYQTGSGFGMGVTISVVGDSFDDTFNTVPIDGYFVGDVRASYAVTDALEIFGRIENVTDEDYETVANFGTPGRAVFGGVRYRM